MTDSTPRFRRARLAVGLVVAGLATFGAGQVASAHTDFDSSLPADGALVEGPLSEVVVNFTNPASPAGEGFELLDPTGSLRTPTSVDETDGTSFVLMFDPPLGAGTYGLRWRVQAGDAHPIDGSFRFEIIEPPATTTVPASEAASVASLPPTTVASIPDAAAASATSAPPTTSAPVLDAGVAPPSAGSDATVASLDEFLNTGSTSGDAAIGRVGRTLTILGTIFGIGVLAALVWTIRGDREELDTQLAWIRLAGLLVMTGGLIEFAGLAESDPTASLGNLLATKSGLATVLKMLGGLAVVLGFHRSSGRVIAPVHSLSAAVATDFAPDTSAIDRDRHDGEHRWSPSSAAAVGLVGYALVLVSFWFDGHTVSKGPWAIHSLVNLVHLGAAAVWGGGVFAMTTVAWMRRRRSERVGLAAMVVRFSTIATVSLAAVIVAGLAMTALILDSPSDVFGTAWGRLLIAKTAVVAVAAGLGGFNHFRLRPALEQRPDDPSLAKELRVSLSIESAVFVAVVVVTAVLVASAT